MPESGEKLLSETKSAVWDSNLLRCVASWTNRSVSLPKLAEFAEQMICAFGEGLPGFVWASGFSQWIADVTESGCCLRGAPPKKDCTQLLVAQFWATMSRKMRIQVSETTYKLLEHKYSNPK